MKANVNGIEAEGTPAEIAEFVREIKTVLVMDDGDIDRIADQLMEAMQMPQRIVVEEESDVTKFDEHEIEKMKDSAEYVERAELSSPVDFIKEAIDKSKMDGVKWEPAPMPQLHGHLYFPDGKFMNGGIHLQNSGIVDSGTIFDGVQTEGLNIPASVSEKWGLKNADFATSDHTAAHMTIKALDPLSPKRMERKQLQDFLTDTDWSPFPFNLVVNQEEKDWPFAVPDLYFDYVDRTFVLNNIEEAARILSGYLKAKFNNSKNKAANEVDSDEHKS